MNMVAHKSLRRALSSVLIVDQIIRHTGGSKWLSRRKVALVVLSCGILYGMVMGSYAMLAGQRSFANQIPQMLYSATKVPLLLVVTVAVSLPSYFVLNSLFGLRDDFAEATRAVIAAQAGMTIVLLSLSPITLFLYVILVPGGDSYIIAVLFNAMVFGISSFSAQYLLARYYHPLIERHHRHRWMLWIWIVVYAFVGIQCAYILRPFIGDPSLDASWIRAESFQNAYVKIFEMVVELFR